MSSTNPTDPNVTVFEFPSTCLSPGEQETKPRLVVTDLGNNKFQFQIEGTPQITGVYKKFSFKNLRLETAEEKYSGILDESKLNPEHRDEHYQGEIPIPYENRQPVKVRVIWYHRLSNDVEILSGRLNEPVIIHVREETICVRGRIYIVNAPLEIDTGDPTGDDPPTWVKGV